MRCASASWLPPVPPWRCGELQNWGGNDLPPMGDALSGQAYWSLRGLGTSPGSSTRSAEVVRGAGACRGVGGGLSACGVSRVVCSCVCVWCAWCAVYVCGCGACVVFLPRIRFNRHRAVRQLEVRERCFERVSSLELRRSYAQELSVRLGGAASVERSMSNSALQGSYIPLGME